ncbi:procathepsin L-like isoform X2 [Stegostoma tigrinum]|uniref:procathepsin L-like isoform X2 n=1 Tax=Stegostoma tigrinum TaxID=3053191 RepID=UPI0028706C65|nr:procathepsin L-like isoform X2 [Stegostoma tigrinum]
MEFNETESAAKKRVNTETAITELPIMRCSLFVDWVLGFILAAASVSTFHSTLDEAWINWKSLHGKQYEMAEEAYRRALWEDNVRFIEQHNLEYGMGKHTFTVGLNQFGDLTMEEFNEHLNGLKENEIDYQACKVFTAAKNVKFPQTVDWRRKGFVTGVKNQGHCGSCWAFSATGSLEGQLFKSAGKLISLSEQNLLDCDRKSRGCNGGTVLNALDYVKQNGINSERSYPYAEKPGECRFNRNNNVTSCACVKCIQPNSEHQLAAAVAEVGPISVAVDAKHRSFQLYKAGVYYEPNCKNTTVNHAMLVVGYGIDQEGKYWIVKNRSRLSLLCSKENKPSLSS